MREDIVLANKKLNRWCGTEDINYHESLDSLFKYAVPKLGVRVIIFDPMEAELACRIRDWIDEADKAIGYAQTEAPALFWAIWEVIKDDLRREEEKDTYL